jgi:hypothetical protein
MQKYVIVYSKLLKGALYASILFAFTSVNAQVSDGYFDTGVSAHLFQTTELEAVEPVTWGPLLRLGLAFAETNNEKLRGYAELRLNFRSFRRNFGEEKFKYRIRSFELPVYGAWNPWKELRLHLGINPMLYAVQLHSDPDNTAETKTSDDFRFFDLAALAGVEYQVSELIGLGIRCDWALIPMVKYTPIGDFGEIGNPITDINYRRFEFFVRWHFI